MTSHRILVGIDLGTTFSLCSVLQNGRPHAIPNSLGEVLTPSAVSVLTDGSLVVGAPARARAITHPERTALAFKRDMGTDRTFDLAGKVFRPEELSAMVLESLRRDAEAALGMAVKDVVVTVPAYFGELQRRATRDACELAGLHPERIVNEPTAAALAYGLHERSRELRAVVLDLGGGTFDVTVLEILEGVVEIQSSAGDVRLGGEDFDIALVEHLARVLRESHGVDPNHSPVARARLKEACEAAKKRLSAVAATQVVLSSFPMENGELADLTIPLTQSDAEALWSPLLARIESPIRRALRDAQARPDGLDEILLVGGATRMPCIARLAATLFGRLPSRALPPDEAVALGAGVQAALVAGNASVEDMVVTDIAPFTLGISVLQRLGEAHVQGVFCPIIERGTVLPASRVERLTTTQDGQDQIRVEVFQGEHSTCLRNTKLGEYLVKGIPRALAGEQPVEVRFSYDLNGILEVDTTIVTTKKTVSLLIEKSPGKLTDQELQKARKRLQQLKFHPRDALPNVTALERAEALYAELHGFPRERLGAAISIFRAALEAQDSGLIGSAREQLQAVIAISRQE